MTDAVSGVTPQSVAPKEIKKPEEITGTTASAVTTDPVKTQCADGSCQGTPTEAQGKKLYMTA